MQAVGDAAEPAAAADRAPVVDAQDDVDAVAAQPGALVEAVLGPGGSLTTPSTSRMAPWRRRAPERQLEQDRLVECERRRSGARWPCARRPNVALGAAAP